MSVFLTAIPLHRKDDVNRDTVFCSTLLTFSNAWETQDQLKELLKNARPVPKARIRTYAGLVPKKDHYGNPLTFVPAGAFVGFQKKPGVMEWDLAIAAFLRILPPETPIVLFWS